VPKRTFSGKGKADVKDPPLKKYRIFRVAPQPFFKKKILAIKGEHNYIIIMKTISFVWDGKKAEPNQKKHKISFKEAQTVFSDPTARMIFDPEHSGNEDRFILLGISSGLRLLVVCHCYLEDDKAIRIISARKANKNEQKQYGSFLL